MPTRIISDIIAGRPVIAGPSDTTVRAACKLMADNRIGALLVVDSNRISGIFTERDALNKVLAGGLDPDSTTLAQVMVRDPRTIRADKPLGYALQFMVDGGFRHVPVVDENGAPLGMVSARDALGADMVQLERDQQFREHLEENIA
jgi:CBS domain-containing protein